MDTVPAPTVRLTLPPSIDHVPLCRTLVGPLAEAAGLDAAAVADLRLAVAEAVANAVLHGSPAGRDPVEVLVEARPGAVVVEVADHGGGFDPATPAPAPGDLPERGLGLVLLRALADELEVRPRGPAGGCIVRLVKRAAG